MENSLAHLCLPIEIAKSLYSKWDAEVILTEEPSVIYSKALDGLSYLEFKNGNIYQGEMSRGLLHGKGLFKWTSGIVYDGQFRNNVIEGKGKYTWPDGSTYVGEVHNGRKEGYGELVSKAENATYSGQWKDGQRNGKGKIQFSNGSFFQGTFSNGIKHGFGKMTYPSGNYYEGMWVNDIKEGYGTMVWVTTNQKYVGNWHNNKQNGQGTHMWLENRAEFKVFRNRYDGNWVEGKRQGYGTFYYSNGAKHEGYWHNNMKEGFGIQTEETGEIKLGYYKADRPLKKEINQHSLPKQVTPLVHSVQHSTGLLPPIKGLETTAGSKDQKALGELKDLKKIGKKPVHSKIQINKKPEEGTLRPAGLPHQATSQSLQKEGSTIQVVSPTPINVFRNTDAEQNPYEKYLDIQNFEVSESILNFLLRSHSVLKHIYKQYSSIKQFYSGMSLECAWKLIRDLKLVDARCNASLLDREFARGYKSDFPMTGQPEQRLLLIQKSTKHLSEEEMSKLELAHHSLQLANHPFKFEWLQTENSGVKLDEPVILNTLYRGAERNIHDGNTVILFRHFVCLLVRLTKMKYCPGSCSDSDFKAALEMLLGRLNQQCETKESLSDSAVRNTLRVTTTDAVSFKSSFAVGRQIMEWAKSINERLFDCLTKNRRSLIGTIDKTVPLKTIYRLLEMAGFLKEPYEKMMFLEKVERYMDTKFTYFKKELKQQASAIMGQLDKSPVFSALLSTEINLWEFHELVYSVITKKIANSNSQEEIKQKYQEAIETLISSYSAAEAAVSKKSTIPLRRVETQKDLLKKALLKRMEEEQRLRIEEQARRQQAERAQQQRQDMVHNDFNIASDAYLLESDEQP